MFSYILRRLLLVIPTVIGATMLVFSLLALMPGGFAGSLMTREGQLRPEERKVVEAYLKQRYGLDKPLPVQYVRWLNLVSPIGVKDIGKGFPGGWKFGFKAPDLGESWSRHRPVGTLILEALPITVMLELLSLPIMYTVALSTGVAAARARGRAADVGVGTVLVGLYSVPEIWIGVLMIGFLTNVFYVRWFPSNGLHDVLSDSMRFMPSWDANGFQRGWLLDMLWHLVLPLACISYVSFAFLSRLTRGALLETLGQDFIRTARAKGLSERVVVYRDAFRNSLMPIITVTAQVLPAIFAGAVIVETIFGIPGMGRLTVDAAESLDRDLLMALVLVVTILQIFSFLIADICYAIADPRVTYAG